MAFHPSLRTPENREKTIMKEQTSIPLNKQSEKRVDIQTAKLFISSGLPAKVKQGKAMLRRLRKNESVTKKLIALRPLYSGKLDAEGARLLAETRTSFIEDIEKRNNGLR